MNKAIVIESQSYQKSEVMIGHETLSVWPWSSWLPENAPVVMVVDPKLETQIEPLVSAIEKSRQAHMTVVPRTIAEHDKTLETVAALYRDFGKHRVTRDTVVVAVGGGVLTDLVGYVAATYLRGLRWIAVPTTLLAQVDAAIGGKVAVNTEFGKNLVGAFHLPAIVAIDTAMLSTLPLKEWRAGLGEVIKSALIAGGHLYESVQQKQEPLGDLTPWWAFVIAETAALKARIVQADLYEHNQRMFLNFGHTAGHALENYFGYGTLSHGEAVGLGTLVALSLSERVLGLRKAVREQVMGWLRQWGLPTKSQPFDPAKIYEIMAQDKKARAYGLQWVLLKDIGDPLVTRQVDSQQVMEALEEIQ
ncbi:3-dehydroquinate synthase [Sulfobacillus thermosulfidooxidans]|uniref:3-dehydroquinate synthase n=1 Tax=Sulfobacillus thermosulfidooxidans TaxID=28034 RepID=UPI00040CD6A7|nr:3-dehydroquinate synthase [Sulfobacillus thermosulfidooxidans]